MSRLSIQNVFPSKDESIFRPRSIVCLALLLGIYTTFFFLYDYLKNICLFFLSHTFVEKIISQDFTTFFDTQINLLSIAISTLAIVTTFLNQRYLGANYKHWMFKYSPYWFTPQENILLSVVNLIGTLLYVITGEYKLIAFFSFLLSWYLFLNMIYQIYIFVIKVSHLLDKIRDKLIQIHNSSNQDTIFDRIYKKLISMQCSNTKVSPLLQKLKDKLIQIYNNTKQDKLNDHIYKKLISMQCSKADDSYLTEETEVIIQMMVMYHADHQDASRSEKIENLKKVVRGLFDNYTQNHNSIVATETVFGKRAMDIIDKGNALVGKTYAYQETRSAQKNLDKALNQWFDRKN